MRPVAAGLSNDTLSRTSHVRLCTDEISGPLVMECLGLLGMQSAVSQRCQQMLHGTVMASEAH